MDNFKCVTDTISSIKASLDEIQAILGDTHTSASNILTDLSDNRKWAGEAQLVGTAFMDLVVQYHGILAGDGSGPVQQASEGLKNYLDKDSSFYEEWQEYQDVLSM